MLKNLDKEDFFESDDGKKLHYKFWFSDKVRTIVLIVYGLTEPRLCV